METVPTTIAELTGFSTSCDCGVRHTVDTQLVCLGDKVLKDVVMAAKQLAAGSKVVLVADKRTFQVAGAAVEQYLVGDGYRVVRCIVPDAAGGRPHADSVTVAFVEQAVQEVDFCVACGAGTINDLTKLASFNFNKPYIAVATAASMNGYTSAIAAIMIDGVKRTVPCHQPFAVIGDLGVLCQAPLELTAAGFGDLESKPTCTADFRLSGKLRGTYYCPKPEAVVLNAEANAAGLAAGLPKGSRVSFQALAEALILSGISMKLAGSSAPASGGEHLISHYFDMMAERDGRIEGSHGAQVGIATVVTATLYERLRDSDPGRLNIDKLVSSRKSVQEVATEIKAHFGPLADELVEEYAQKQLSDAAYEAELVTIKSNWDALWGGLSDVLRPGSRIRDLLSAAGAPTQIHSVGLTAAHLETAYLKARQIRGRFTVLDFAWDLGLLGTLKQEVLRSSGCLG